MEERREGTRKRRPTKVFKFEPGHTLFASLTRKSEENIKKKKSNAEGQKRFRTKQIDQKNGAEVARLKALVKKQERKIKYLEKKAAKK